MVHNHSYFLSPKDRVVGLLPNGRTPWLISGGDPNHLSNFTVGKYTSPMNPKGI